MHSFKTDGLVFFVHVQIKKKHTQGQIIIEQKSETELKVNQTGFF